MKKRIFIFSLLVVLGFLSFFIFQKRSETKVYDCFPFFNELDLLEVRLNELYDVVDYFVIVENPLTFTGNPKPLYFEENKHRFEKFSDKIIHVVGPKIEVAKDAWEREFAQRNDIMLGLKNAKNKDIVIISDLDEIVRASIVPQIKTMLMEKQKNKKTKYKYVRIEQNCYRYYLNRLYEEPIWARAVATTYKQVKKKSPQKLRENLYNVWPVIKNGGWHFSYLGNLEKFRYKLEAYAHQENNNEAFKSEKNFLDQIEKCKKVQVDDTFPKTIVDNLNYYQNMHYIDN